MTRSRRVALSLATAERAAREASIERCPRTAAELVRAGLAELDALERIDLEGEPDLWIVAVDIERRRIAEALDAVAARVARDLERTAAAA